MPTEIEFSSGETSVLGLKIGRCNTDLFDETSLYDQIVKNSYDICRLKIPSEDEMASYRLNKTGLPFFFSGSIRRYKTRISEPPVGQYNFPDLAFEMYDGSQDQLLKDMLVGTWGTYPIGYYRTPYLESLVTKEIEIESVFQFYKKFNLNKNYPNNSIMFIRHGDVYVGFFALNVVNNNLESHIGGILAPYRKSGYFLDKLRYIKEFCLKNHLEHFIFGARNENAEVQKIFQYVGFQARGSENVFHIPSLLSFSQKEPVSIEFESSTESGIIYKEVLNRALVLTDKMKTKESKISFDFNYVPPKGPVSKFTLRFSFPILSDRESLLVIQSNSDHIGPFIGYFRMLNT